MTDIKEAVEAAAAAVTGPGTPEAVKAVAVDPPALLWVRILAGPALCALIAGTIVVLAWGQRLGLWTEASERARADYVGITGLLLTMSLGLVFWMIAPGRPTKLEIKAGPASVTLDGGKE